MNIKVLQRASFTMADVLLRWSMLHTALPTPLRNAVTSRARQPLCSAVRQSISRNLSYYFLLVQLIAYA